MPHTFFFFALPFVWALMASNNAVAFTIAKQFKHPASTTSLGPVARNGLSYEDVEIGSGRRVNSGDTILCYYEGSYEKGVGPFSKKFVFDQTDPGEPIELVIGKGQVIEGWDLGIAGDIGLDIPPMCIGGDRRIKIPSALAYGEEGAGGGAIPPNQDLDFQIAILSAEKQGGISLEYRLKGYAIVAVFAVTFVSLGYYVLSNL